MSRFPTSPHLQIFRPETALRIDSLRTVRAKQALAISHIHSPDYQRLQAIAARVQIPPQVTQQARQQAAAVRQRVRQAATARRSSAKQAKITAHGQQLRLELANAKQLLATRSLRPPDQVVADVLKRSQMATRLKLRRADATDRGMRRKEGLPAKLVVHTRPTTIAHFEKDLIKALAIPANQQLADYGIEVDTFYEKLATDRLFVVRFAFSHTSSRKELWNLASVLRKKAGFISVQPERVRSVLFSSLALDANPEVSRDVQWHLADIKVPLALKVLLSSPSGKQGGEGVVIGHPDTGWREHGQYVRPNEQQVDLTRAYNAITGQTGSLHAKHGKPPHFNPNVCHGTATGCLMVGQDDATPTLATRVNNPSPRPKEIATNPVDVLGVAPKARVLPIKCVDDMLGVVRIADEHLARAIEYAIFQGVDVISISLGGVMHPAVRVAIQEAIRRNIIVIAAAGQSGHIVNVFSPEDSVTEPASLPDVIAVAGSTKNRRPWSQTHTGPSVDITAPAHGVWVADFNDVGTESVLAGSGTSFSAAITAGVAALWVSFWSRQHLLATYPNIPLARVFRYLLRRTADNLGGQWDTGRFGAGIIDAEALLKEPLPAENLIPGADMNRGNVISAIGDGLEAIGDAWGMLEDLAQDSTELAESLIALGGYWTKAAGDRIVKAAQDEYERMLSVVNVTTGEIQRQAQQAARAAEQALIEAAETVEESVDEVVEMAEETVNAATEVVEVVADAAGEAAEDVVDLFESLW